MSDSWVELKLPTPSDIGRFMLWVGGRCFLSGMLLGCHAWKGLSKLSHSLAEMSERFLVRILRVWDALPLMGMSISHTIEAEVVPITNIETATDIPSLLAGKHLILLGDTGTGKSTLAQYIAYLIPGRIWVYDPDASPDEWQGLEVVGRKGDYTSIEVAMQADLTDLQKRIELRGEKGDGALAGMETTIICEEYPNVASKVEIANEWLKEHARRGRKPKRFLIIITQDDGVKALDLEGEGSTRKNFRYFRLGKYAVEHAKRLGNKQLAEWLKSQSYPCLADDVPVRLPSVAEMRAVSPRLLVQPSSVNSEPTETPTLATIQLPENELNGVSNLEKIALWKAIKASELPDSRIVKEILGYTGERYQQGREILEQLKQQFGE